MSPPKGRGITILVLVLIPAALIAYKTLALGYALEEVVPRTLYRVRYVMDLDGRGESARVRTFVPSSDARQTVQDERHEGPLNFSLEQEGANRSAVFEGTGVADGTRLQYSVAVDARSLRFELDPALELPAQYPKSVQPFLQAEEAVQVDAPEIHAALEAIGAHRGSIVERLQRIYDFTSSFPQRPFKGLTDALTALRLKEASCNGKSRLFVALARASGIPSRLVGGLVMKEGHKRTSHQWVEAYVAGHWVPFCPTNGHFAELPETYLSLYQGDEVLFRSTKDTNFRYHFEIDRELVPSEKAKASFRFFNAWAMFERRGMPFSLLRTVLLLPIAALVVVLFRNVIGMPTYGTFLPALLAAAAAETGALWGLIGVILIVVTIALLRRYFQRFQILHSPTLAILLTGVTLAMLTTGLIADHLGLAALTRISVFPIAVLAITSERFYLSLTERGPRTATKELAGTLAVMLACYVVMASLALQVLVTGFPEVLLWAVAANLYLGRWIGLRVFEYLRFRNLLERGATEVAR